MIFMIQMITTLSYLDEYLSAYPCSRIPMSTVYQKPLESFCDCNMTSADPDQTTHM